MAFDYSRFFVLGETFDCGAFRVRSVDDDLDPFALTRAERTPRQPVQFRRDEGMHLYDFIGTTWAVLYLVSDRIINLLADRKFTGWTTYPVEIRDGSDDLVPGYHGLAVTGRCGPIDDTLSPIEVLPPPVPGGKSMPHHLGLRFQPATWDGSDLFTPEGTGFVFLTESVADGLLQLKLDVTNLSVEPLTEVRRLVVSDT